MSVLRALENVRWNFDKKKKSEINNLINAIVYIYSYLLFKYYLKFEI